MADDDNSESNGASAAKNVWATSIIASLIASAVFLVFFQPILTAASGITASILSSFGSGVLDSIYAQAAIGYLQPIVFNIQMIIIVVMMNISFIPAIATLAVRRKEAAESDSSGSKKESKICRFCRYFMYLAPAVMALVAIYTLSSSFICIQAEASFLRYMSASDPYLSEQQEEVVRAKWALMNSRKEYVTIMRGIEAQAAGKWELPRRLI